MTALLALALGTFLCAHPGTTDGDTIRCQSGDRVRLWGINAAEAHAPGGPEATRALSRIIAGRDLICTIKGRPSYGRVVALCRADGRDVAAEMVRGGFAEDWAKFSGGFYRVRP